LNLQSGFRPRMMGMITMITAMTSRIWMKPPSVYDDTIPRSQRITRIIAIVSNIGVSLWLHAQCGDECCVRVAVLMLE
jgi:hypothetical protein